MKGTMKGRILAFVLAFAMIITLLPSGLGTSIAEAATSVSKSTLQLKLVENKEHFDEKTVITPESHELDSAADYYVKDEIGDLTAATGYYVYPGADYYSSSDLSKLIDDDKIMLYNEDGTSAGKYAVSYSTVYTKNEEKQAEHDEYSYELHILTLTDGKESKDEVIAANKYSLTAKETDNSNDIGKSSKASASELSYDGFTFKNVEVEVGKTKDLETAMTVMDPTGTAYANGTDTLTIKVTVENNGSYSFKSSNDNIKVAADGKVSCAYTGNAEEATISVVGTLEIQEVKVEFEKPEVDSFALADDSNTCEVDKTVYTNDSPVTFSYTGKGVSSDMLTVDGKAYASSNVTISDEKIEISGLSDGKHSVAIGGKAVDFILDTTAPTATYDVIPTGNSSKLEIAADDTGVGIATVKINFGKEPTDWSQVKAVPAQAGDHTESYGPFGLWSYTLQNGRYYADITGGPNTKYYVQITDKLGNVYTYTNKESDNPSFYQVSYVLSDSASSPVKTEDGKSYYNAPIEITITVEGIDCTKKGVEVNVTNKDKNENKTVNWTYDSDNKQSTAVVVISDKETTNCIGNRVLALRLDAQDISFQDQGCTPAGENTCIVDQTAPELSFTVPGGYTLYTNDGKVYIQGTPIYDSESKRTKVEPSNVKIAYKITDPFDSDFEKTGTIDLSYADDNVSSEEISLTDIQDNAGNKLPTDAKVTVTTNATNATNATTTTAILENSATEDGSFSATVNFDTQAPFYVTGKTEIELTPATGTYTNGIYNGDIKADVYVTDGTGVGIEGTPTAIVVEGNSGSNEFKECNVAVDENDATHYTFTISPKGDVESDVTAVEFTVKDNLGNTRTYTKNFAYDNKQPEVTVTFSAIDEGEKEVEGKYYEDNQTYYYKVPRTLTITVDDVHKDGGTYVLKLDGNDIAFELDEQQTFTKDFDDGSYSYDGITVTDAAGNEANEANITYKNGLPKNVGGAHKFVVDTVAPKLELELNTTAEKQTVKQEQPEGDCDYYNGDVTITATLTEENVDWAATEVDFSGVNYFDDRTQADDHTENSKIWSITLTDQTNAAKLGDKLPKGGITAKISDRAGNPAEYEVKGLANDENSDAGTYSYAGNTIIVDKNTPVITFNTPDESALNKSADGNTLYYDDDQTLKVNVAEINLDTKKSIVSYKLKKADSNPTDENAELKPVQNNNGVYTAEIPVEAGQMVYDVHVQAVDYAKHQDDENLDKTYIVDNTEPTASLDVEGKDIESFFTNGKKIYVKFTNPVKKDSSKSQASSGETQEAGSSHTVTVKLTVNDANITTAAEQSDKGYVVKDVTGVSGSGHTELNTSGQIVLTATLKVEANNSVQLPFSFQAKDLAGNAIENWEKIDCKVNGTTNEVFDKCNEGVRTVASEGEDPVYTLSSCIAADQNRPYSTYDKTPVDVTLTTSAKSVATLSDGVLLYSGNVTYSLTVTDPEVNNTYSGLETVGWVIKEGSSEGAHGTLTSKGNSASVKVGEKTLTTSVPVTVSNEYENNTIEIVVTAVDQAGNTTYYVQKLAIDNYAPRVTASYSNNSVMNEKYFKADRLLTVNIEDLNFDASKTHLTSQIGASGWKTSGIKHTATINYNKDGDYTFKMDTKDLAGNTGNTTNIFKGDKAPWEFTIDKTVPVIKISFDNNSYLNGKYFNADRTATISITEHNFAASDAKIVTTPSVSGFSGSGDVHTATVKYNTDGNYSLQADFTDLAGNQAVTQKVDEFVIDKTAPVIAIVSPGNTDASLNSQAFTGTVTPQFSLTDTNFDKKGYTVSLTVTKLDGSETLTNKWSVANIKNGQQLNFANIESGEDTDGVYLLKITLTDLAGNKAEEKTYTYTLNRTGTVFVVEDSATAGLLNGYSQSGNVSDVVIRAYNASMIKSATVKVNNEELSAGDYTFTKVNAGSGWYAYDITISKEYFQNKGDGTYDVTVTTVDAAGNTSQSKNSLHNAKKQATVNFTVDDELPSGTVIIDGYDKGVVKASEADVTVQYTDGYAVSRVVINVTDVDGNPVEGYPVTLETAEELEQYQKDGYQLILPEGKTYKVSAEITDAAGNTYTVDTQQVMVTTNGLKAFIAQNPILFWGLIIVILLLLLFIILLLKRRKDEEEKERKRNARRKA